MAKTLRIARKKDKHHAILSLTGDSKRCMAQLLQEINAGL